MANNKLDRHPLVVGNEEDAGRRLVVVLASKEAHLHHVAVQEVDHENSLKFDKGTVILLGCGNAGRGTSGVIDEHLHRQSVVVTLLQEFCLKIVDLQGEILVKLKVTLGCI